VRGPDGRDVTAATTDGKIGGLDVRNDGTVLVTDGGQAWVVPPGSAAVGDGRPLVVANGCTLAAAAWDDQVAVAWEHCAGGWLLVRWSADGATADGGQPVPGVSSVTSTAVDAGQVLVVLSDGRVARLVNGALEELPLANTLSDVDW
jgi:hypothetical protein